MTQTSYRKMLIPMAAAAFLPSLAYAEESGISTAELQFVLNSFSFLVHGFLVMLMAAGFCMLEAGSVRSKNVSSIILKNISLYGLAGVMFWLAGYNLMYANVDGGWIGSLSIWSGDDAAAMSGDYSAGYSSHSDWFFQMVFVATTASIVSGTIAERSKLWSFLLFVAILTAVIYPIAGSWKWGGGWLDARGFQDFAGSTLVHSVGGWAALTGAIIIGSRRGRFNSDGSANPMPGSSMPLVGLGTFILWFGWFGFNGGSQLALGSAADVISIAKIYVNTNIAAGCGMLAAMLASQIMYKKADTYSALNGALGGLVAITAEPLMPNITQAAMIGAVGGLLIVGATNLMLKAKIDDVVGAIPVHLFCGIWGTLAVCISNPDANLMTQLLGVTAIGLFTIITTAITWYLIKYTIGIRYSQNTEELGLDEAELGNKAYPEFT